MTTPNAEQLDRPDISEDGRAGIPMSNLFQSVITRLVTRHQYIYYMGLNF